MHIYVENPINCVQISTPTPLPPFFRNDPRLFKRISYLHVLSREISQGMHMFQTVTDIKKKNLLYIIAFTTWREDFRLPHL